MSILLALAPVLAPQGAGAQIDMGVASIYQEDVLVGLVWVPRFIGSCRYKEFWFLAPDYVYPGSLGLGETIETTIVHQGRPDFRNAKEFFAFAAQQIPGGKRLKVAVREKEDCGPVD